MLKHNINETARGYFFMILGCLCYALSLDLFLVPNSIVGGGFSGLATLLNLVFNTDVGIIVIALNIPVYLMAFKSEGKTFIFRALVTVVVLGVFTDILSFLPPLTDNPILAAVYGGFAQGVGIGLFVKYSFSSGGTELLARIINRFLPYFSIPLYLAILDAAIVIAGAIALKNPENVLYALILIVISTKISDTILMGLNKAKLCYIITDYPSEISELLLSKSPRGVTLLNGTGMYTNTPRGVLMTCVKNTQLTEMKQMVRQIDENAFVIVNDTYDVYGKGFKINK